MAEAVVDGTPMSRFFCHKCNIEIERLLPNYTCPQCASGFIEELEGGTNDSGSTDNNGEDLDEIGIRFNRYRNLIERMMALPTSGQQPAAGNRNNRRDNTSGDGRSVSVPRITMHPRRSSRQEAMLIESFIQEFILNPSGATLGHPITQDGQPPVLFLGNPGDYVWGRDGLDAIVTHLLNQMDGTGPPPLPRKQIDELPTTSVSQSQVDCKLQCSVCWEDFKLSEPVKQLPCQHLYHTPCIVPWLKLHGTCPICRQNLGPQNSAEANEDGSNLAALFRATHELSNSRTLSSSSSSESNDISDSSNEI